MKTRIIETKRNERPLRTLHPGNFFKTTMMDEVRMYARAYSNNSKITVICFEKEMFTDMDNDTAVISLKLVAIEDGVAIFDYI